MSRFIPTSDPRFFEAQRVSWSSPPIDGVGYLPSEELLRKDNPALKRMIDALEIERYNVNGWRNHENKWRKYLGLDDTHGKYVLDYGCGCGVEALQFARNRNTVYIADVAGANLQLAERVASIYGWEVRPILLSMIPPFFDAIPPLDVFYCVGVLHHIPNARDVLLRASDALKPDGEIRLMLYSDIGWQISTGTPTPPVEEDIETNPNFQKFTGIFDCVGCYADWYNAEKLKYRFGDFLDLIDFQYICSDNAYCVAILRGK
ncbi:MAG: Methyltransferase type 12 [Parcubacteria group bacterium GW2011_GWB1_56_8]|nr:MAG: Methyltransferase type 12 [Parcubacteria group bacterium GW2011_GWB1_56_8]